MPKTPRGGQLSISHAIIDYGEKMQLISTSLVGTECVKKIRAVLIYFHNIWRSFLKCFQAHVCEPEMSTIRLPEREIWIFMLRPVSSHHTLHATRHTVCREGTIHLWGICSSISLNEKYLQKLRKCDKNYAFCLHSAKHRMNGFIDDTLLNRAHVPFH